MQKTSNKVAKAVPMIASPAVEPSNYTLAPMSAKGIVKASVITPKKVTLSISQSNIILFTRNTEGLTLSESYACLSNIFHYQFKAKAVKLDKFNPLVLTLSFGDKVYKVEQKPRTNKRGEAVPFTSGSVGSLLKTMYHRFAADILEHVTLQGVYLNYVHAANSIARFTPVPPTTK